MKKAIIIGCNGQDGTYLFRGLQQRGYEIIGIGKDVVRSTFPESIQPIDIVEKKEVYDLLSMYRPDEIYHLAAVHQSSEDIHFDDAEWFRKSFDINVLSLINFLDGIVKYSGHSRLFYAASSHIFGDPVENIQDETTPFSPNCIYGITKYAGVQACRFYREKHAVFASVGILYNHESPLRSSKFISKKIVKAAVAIRNRLQDKLIVGNLDASIDWGYAPDYVEAMYSILQLSSAGDFVVSSGYTHTVRDFIKGVFEYLELEWSKYVKEDPSLITKKVKQNLKGDYSKLNLMTGWEPSVSFDELIKLMVSDALKDCGDG